MIKISRQLWPDCPLAADKNNGGKLNMSKLSMTQMEVVAALLNGCHIQWLQRCTPSSPRFRVYSPCGERIGSVHPSTVELLWDLGFLKVEGSPVKCDDGDTKTVVVLAVPKMPFFSLKEVPGNE